MDLQREVERIAGRRDLRSADRANMRRILQQMKRGRPLTNQDREQLWAYMERYGDSEQVR